ncbi:M16 family metallopeptidase [Trichlorobacter ammonificans]|uniref:Predicted Zn-dependent peptidase n=1 Tax=Trichlorobacter ammonificans TaxID=2916410 RepID=A0ABN8HGH0_9BACT|nr:pitrilysin family protein [Trichlorobacter ammonificans]CAH2030238.1 Predicted Zn-dependent peptidase [Trichlorobacter ammonificans]
MTAIGMTTLENGLRMVTVPLPHLHSAEVAVYLKVGGRNDPPGESGLAHFLEHMLFRGAGPYRSSLEIEAAFESLGGSVNAATDADSTCFFGRIHPRHVSSGLAILAEMLLRPRLEGVDLERRIIGEEALQDLNEEGEEINPDVVVGQLLWPAHPLGGSTLGTLEDLERISDASLRRHLAAWYRPNNAVVVAAGPVRHEELVAAAADCLGGWQAAPLPDQLPVTALPDGPALALVRNPDSQVTVQLAFRACQRDSSRLITQKVLRRLLAGGGCSRLHLALRENLGLVYSVDAGFGAYDETGCLTIDLATAPENLCAVLETTLAELRRLADEPAVQEELERVKTVYLAELDYSRDSVTDMAVRYGWGTLMGVVREIDDDQRLVREVTAEGVRGLAEELFKPDNRFLGVIGPQEGVNRAALERLLAMA